MANPTLFISHSTNKPDSSTRTLAVRQALEGLLANQWHVFVDSERIQPGDAWRTAVLYHLATAAGAIVLFDNAALKSGWVESEAQILSFRRSMHPGFPLVPVLFTDLRPEDDYFKKYQPFQLNEVQALADDGQEPPEALAQRIASQFTAPGEAVTNHWIEAVSGYLKDVKEGPLQLAATALNFKDDVPGVMPKEEAVEGLRRAVAQTMHYKPVLEATKALNPLINNRAVNVEVARGLSECLTAKWVENEAMEVLICASRRPTTFVGTLTLNTNRQDIVDHYLSRARFELQSDSVFVIPVDATDGEDETTILPPIRKAIGDKIGDYFDTETGDPLPLKDAVDRKLAENDASALCVLPESCVKGNVLSTLRHDFPRITFIVRVEKRLRDHPLPDAKPLDPRKPGEMLNVLSNLSSRLENLLNALTKKP